VFKRRCWWSVLPASDDEDEEAEEMGGVGEAN
jgi:hypothetical protein